MIDKRITVYYGDGYWDVYEGWVYWMIKCNQGMAVYRILENGDHVIIGAYEDVDNFYVEEDIL